jgi:hypothetical protein
LVEGCWWGVVEAGADQGSAFCWSVTLRVDLEVVDAVLVHERELDRGSADRPVPALAFASLELGQGTPDTDEQDGEAVEDRQTVGKTPTLSEHMIHDHIVTRRRHPGYGPVETQDSSLEDRQERVIGPVAPRANVMELVDTQMEPSAIQHGKQFLCDARLPRTRRPVEQNQAPGAPVTRLGRQLMGCGDRHRPILPDSEMRAHLVWTTDTMGRWNW